MANDPRFMDHPTAGWVLIGTDGAIVSADARFGAIVASDPDALSGRRFDALVAAADAQRWASARAAGRAWRGILTLSAGGGERTVMIEHFAGGSTLERLTVIRAELVREIARPLADVDAELAAFQAVQATGDLTAAARAVLQAVRTPLPFDWALVARFDPTGPNRSLATTVLATYPGPLAGIDGGSRWTPLAAHEQTVVDSGTPSLWSELPERGADGSPLARLVAFGMRSRLQIPVFAHDQVAGTVALYSADPHAFRPGDGLRLERITLPFRGRLQSASAVEAPARTPLAEARPPASPPVVVDTATLAAAAPGPAERDRWAPARPERSSLIEERLGALGEMVSGVAHELNNPLTAILGYAQILPSLEGFDRDQALTTIEQETLRASRIVRNLLAFARQHRASLEPVDIEAILRRVIDVRQYSLQADRVTIETRFAGVRSVMADEYQLEQVFLNLLNNAHQAMQIDGGTVTVATEQLASSVRVYISDTGPGVPDEVADRIFEPFFTTREVGTGVGLGLAIVYGIVAEHGGHVWAQPAATGGAEFVVELPAPTPARAGAVDGVAGEGTAIEGAVMGRVLVVDDELPIRALTNEILSGLGYDVATAASANDAFRLLASGSFDALIVDMGLPRMDATAFQRRVSERWPRLSSRLLWITDEPESDRAAALMGDGRHLEKPFGTQELLGALRALLATPS